MRLAALLFVLPSALPAQQIIGTRDSLTARVDSIFRAFDRTDAPGCALGIYREGEILYARGYGMANLEHGIPITPRTVMDVGSVSKQFTTTAMLMLQREGRLSLEHPLRRYVPEMPPYAEGITLRQALNHLGALRDQYTLWELGFRSFEGPSDSVDMLRTITRSAQTNWPVADRYFYSNAGYALSGQIVYRLTGTTLPRWLATNVFQPLGMRDTRVMDDHGAPIPNRAQAYSPRGTGYRIAISLFDGIPGAGSVHTTVEDFAQWERAWHTGQGIPRDELIVQGRRANDSLINYALGVNVTTLRGVRAITHTGSWSGYRAASYRFPDDGVAVAAFCNVSNAGPDTLVQKVAAVYLGHRMTPDTIGAWESALTSAAEVPADIGRLRQLAGVWRHERDGEVRRTRIRADSLMYGLGRGTRLVPIGAGRYRVGRTGTEITFEGPAAAPSVMLVRGRGGVTRYQRADLFVPGAAQLADFAGEYRSDEIETTYTLAPDSGGLALTVHHRRRQLWEPMYRDAFAGGVGLVEFTRDARGAVNGFVIQSGRVRNLRFTKLRPGAVADH